MFKRLTESNRLPEFMFLGVSSFICLGLSLFRVNYTETKQFLFLNWNLFLAFVPWILSSLVILNPKIQQSKLTLFILLGSWILFFPNAPYILTDLFHLSHNSSMPIWFDLVLILSYAWVGLLFGFFSLRDIEELLAKQIKPSLVRLIIISLLFLGSFGIYLGRFLRWNSWNLVNKPSQLLEDISDRFINPFDHPRTWGFTLFMGIFLNLLYWSFRIIRRRNVLLS
jgi:uncharacterized membrane protein